MQLEINLFTTTTIKNQPLIGRVRLQSNTNIHTHHCLVETTENCLSRSRQKTRQHKCNRRAPEVLKHIPLQHFNQQFQSVSFFFPKPSTKRLYRYLCAPKPSRHLICCSDGCSKGVPPAVRAACTVSPKSLWCKRAPTPAVKSRLTIFCPMVSSTF